MRAEPTVILEVDRRLAQFIRACRPARADTANPLALGRWHAAQEVRKILQDACPYEPGSAARHAWFVEKYGDAAGAVIGND
ncbi:MAG TPA: hypothetical protein VMS38_15050 [Pseudorhodoferax sp.]|jgi:hypothetical protein|nr:hypothetical protein [Pseudorhodoferax sp.]